jgi:hypothetical protein
MHLILMSFILVFFFLFFLFVQRYTVIHNFLNADKYFMMQQQFLTKNLTSLPPELTVIVLKNLPDFNSLFSAIQACKQLYLYYQDDDKSVITSIGSNIYQHAIHYDRECGSFLGQGPCLIIQQLIVAIKTACVNRDVILQMFTHAWIFLHDRELEELLIPVAMGLAWSFELDDRRQDAIKLLTQIYNQHPPFSLSCFRPTVKNFHRTEKYPGLPCTFAPLEYLLYKLSKENMHSLEPKTEQLLLRIYHRGKMLQELPAALITRDGIKFFMTEALASK